MSNSGCRTRWLSLVLVILGLVGLPAGRLSAQDKKAPHGRVQVGVRHLGGNRGSSKFEEYRHIPRGLFLQRFELDLGDLFAGNFFLNFQTRETLERDQSYLLSAGVYGKYRVLLRWNQTPHAFTNTARSLFVEASPGVFTLPTLIRSDLQTTPTDAPLFLAGTDPRWVALRRDMASGTFIYTPSADWRFLVQYNNKRQRGVRPFGTTTNSFTHSVELPEPIHYRTQQATAMAEYANSLGGVQVSYLGSVFRNRVSEVVWDIPFRVTDVAGTAARGRLDLYPNNSAHSLSVAGALNLGKATRLLASIVPGWMSQNDPFLPFTINSALTGVPALPAASLAGKKQTLAMNYTLTSNLIPTLMLTARYRSYDYDNHTPSLVFSSGYVRTDATLSTIARQSLPYAYNRQTTSFEGSWEFAKGSFAKLVYDWERFDRDYRDVERSNEHTVGTAVDLSPANWFLFRLSYKHGSRKPRHYEPNEASFPLGEGAFALGQLHELRKFDQADRARNRADSLLQLSPTDTLTFSATYGTTQDDFRDSLYGMLKDINYNWGLDLTYSPRPEFSVFAEYTRERYRSSQRSRQRVPPTATAPANDSTNNDWESHIRDLIDTWGAGLNASLFRHRILAEVFYGLSTAKAVILTRATGSATLPGFLVTTAENYPNTSNRFHQVVGTVKFRVTENLLPRFDYRYENYGRTDFQIDRISPYMFLLDSGTRTSLFLGADVPGYAARILAIGLEYTF